MNRSPLFKMVLLIVGLCLAVILPIYFSWHPYSPKSPPAYWLGVLGSIMMASGATLYAIRKRVRLLKNIGNMSSWLNAHITLCILGPLLVVYHTGFMVRSLNAAIAFYAMLIVASSGVIGRYIYRHFQFSLSGERATLKEMLHEVEELDQKIASHFSRSQSIIETIRAILGIRDQQKNLGALGSFLLMIKLDWLERRLKRQIRKTLRPSAKPGVDSRIENEDSFKTIVLDRMNLEKKISALESTTKLFVYWHKLHVPFIWILAITLIVHMAAVTVF